MASSEQRKQRLERLIAVACAYQGWTRRRVAEALGRDPTKLVPASGNPKLDLVVALAGIIDAPISDVVEFICGPPTAPTADNAARKLGFERLDDQAIEAHEAGEYQMMVELASRSFIVAQTPRERALACNREYGGWDGLGRFQNALEAVRRGLEEAPIPAWLELMLQSNLANAHYTLWNLTEARTTASDLLDRLDLDPPGHRNDPSSRAFALYVRGNAYRRLMGQNANQAERYACAAAEDLARARDLYLKLADEDASDSFKGVANSCQGGLLEVEVALGRTPANDALEQVMTRIDGVIDPSSAPRGDALESLGWWCVFGCNIALRHLDRDQIDRPLAILTNKAYEIADRLDNWAMRERALSLELARREEIKIGSGETERWLMDAEDIGILVGTMGRFPRFRDTGWRILRSAGLVGQKGDQCQ